MFESVPIFIGWCNHSYSARKPTPKVIGKQLLVNSENSPSSHDKISVFLSKMTLPDFMDQENVADARQLKIMSCTLRTCLKQALRRHGLICGMTSCAEMLHSDPNTVMMCILPSSGSSVSDHIHQTLIQAFCRENNILIIELNDHGKLAFTIAQLTGRGRDVSVIGKAEDTSCVLIQYPKHGPSKHDESLFQFYESTMNHSYPMPHLSLPD